MEFDFAICYFGLTRSTKKVYESHYKYMFDVLKRHNLSFKVFMHTWKTNDNKQRVWENVVPQEIDYSEYKLLNPDVYQIDNQDDFMATVDMDQYFYKQINKHYEWLPQLVYNHICALESQKRSVELVETAMSSGQTFKRIMIVRPDTLIEQELPIEHILANPDALSIPNQEHYEGYNDRFAIGPYSLIKHYGKRMQELAEFRKYNGRIVSEKYVKFIVDKYKIPLNFIQFKFTLVRP